LNKERWQTSISFGLMAAMVATMAATLFFYPDVIKSYMESPDFYASKIAQDQPPDLFTLLSMEEKESLQKLMLFRNNHPEYDDLDNMTLAIQLAGQDEGFRRVSRDLLSIHSKIQKLSAAYDITMQAPRRNEEGRLADLEQYIQLTEYYVEQ